MGNKFEYKYYNAISSKNSYNQLKDLGIKRCLISYFYLKKSKGLLDTMIEDGFDILIDSGLFTFSNKAKPSEEDMRNYCEEYIEFVDKYKDCENILGFFELDCDIVNYDYKTFVLPYQKRLLEKTNKIYLVYQKGRTQEDLENMLKENVDFISIPSVNRRRKQMNINYDDVIDCIHKHKKKVHLLGCSTVDLCYKVESSDSTNAILSAGFGLGVGLKDDKWKMYHYDDYDFIPKTLKEIAVYNLKYMEKEYMERIREKYEEQYG